MSRTNPTTPGQQTLPNDVRDELGVLIEAVCEDRITAEQHARLEELLLASAAARSYYLHYIDLHGALHWDLAATAQSEDDSIAELVDATIMRVARSQLDLEPSLATSTQPQAVPSSTIADTTGNSDSGNSNSGNSDNPTSRFWSRRQTRQVARQLATAVAGCLILGCGIWIGNQTAKPHAPRATAINHNTTSPAAANPHSAEHPAMAAASPVQQHGKPLVANGATAANTNSNQKSPSSGNPATQPFELPSDGAPSLAVASNGIPSESPAVAANTIATHTALETPNAAVSATTPQTTADAKHGLAGSSAASASTVIAYINEQLQAKWKEATVAPSTRADDAEWLRRLHLDLVGHIPSVSEFEKFVANKNPAKRAIEVDRLLDSPAFARNFATIWTNLLVGRASREEVNRTALASYLRQKFGHNRPWQEIVFDLVAAEGRTDQNGAANFLVAHLNGGAIPATGITSRLFLGEQLQCSQCHNHPFNNSKQEQFWAFNSFFQQAVVVRIPKYDEKTGRMTVAGIELATKDIDEPRFYETRNGLMKVAYPAFKDQRIDTGRAVNRRRELARLMTSREDSGLAPAFVNRMWEHFHGRSFTPIIDDLGPHVAPSHPALLDRLSAEFVQSGYDIKQLIRWICNSDSYQLTSRFGEANGKDNPETGEPPLFSHMYVKPMNPEQLYDSLVVATQGQLAGGSTLDQSDKSRDTWMRQYFVSFETEENDEVSTLDGSITQSLLMMNGDLIQDATAVRSGTWLHKLLSSKSNETERIQTLFISALSRQPTSKELASVKKLLKGSLAHKNTAEQAYQDIYWALLNSNEFILNH